MLYKKSSWLSKNNLASHLKQTTKLSFDFFFENSLFPGRFLSSSTMLRRRSPSPFPTRPSGPRATSWTRGRCSGCRGTWPSRKSSAGWSSSRDRKLWRTVKLQIDNLNVFVLLSTKQRKHKVMVIWSRMM